MFDLELHLLAQLLVERAERFVHQHDLRLEHQRARQGDALLLAAGELRRLSDRRTPPICTMTALERSLALPALLTPRTDSGKATFSITVM